MRARGIAVVPDSVTNAGGVTVSCFEWQQNQGGEHWSAEEVDQKLQAIMTAAVNDMWQTSQTLSIPLRTAAHSVALCRIRDAMGAA